MTRSKKSKLERQSKTIVYYKVTRDDEGNYIPYCRFGNHPGIIGTTKARVCVKRNCRHYSIYREETPYSKELKEIISWLKEDE